MKKPTFLLNAINFETQEILFSKSFTSHRKALKKADELATEYICLTDPDHAHEKEFLYGNDEIKICLYESGDNK